MGTRSITTFISSYKDEETGKRKTKKIVTMYRQYDGYPSGHGVELAEFLADGEVVNGYSRTDKKIFNGIGCLTAQVVAHFKDGVGNIYLEAPRKPDWEDYAYEVIVDWDTKEITIKVISVGYESPNKTIFKGSPSELIKAVETEAIEG